MTLIEAMACGTPFVASPVGAVTSLNGGLLAEEEKEFVVQIDRLLHDAKLWSQCAKEGITHYERSFKQEYVKAALVVAIEGAVDRYNKCGNIEKICH